MKKGKFKDFVKKLKVQYDKFDKKMFFISFYSANMITMIDEIVDFNGFINNMSIDMVHIHAIDSQNYLDVYEWNLEYFEITDVQILVKQNGKNFVLNYYDTPEFLRKEDPIYAIQVDNDCNIIFHKLHSKKGYGIRSKSMQDIYDENGYYFCKFTIDYFNYIIEREDGYFLFFSKEKYKGHMTERLLKHLVKKKKEIIKQEQANLKKLQSEI